MNAITIDGVTQTRTMQFFAFVSNGKEKDYDYYRNGNLIPVPSPKPSDEVVVIDI